MHEFALDKQLGPFSIFKLGQKKYIQSNKFSRRISVVQNCFDEGNETFLINPFPERENRLNVLTNSLAPFLEEETRVENAEGGIPDEEVSMNVEESAIAGPIFEVGDRVSHQFDIFDRNGDFLETRNYSGSVIRVHLNGNNQPVSYDVHFDEDGTTETKMPPTELQSMRSTRSTARSSSSTRIDLL